MSKELTYEEENDILLKNYLNEHVFSYWKTPGKNNGYASSLELIISSACNTKCTYCYYKNFGEKLNPVSLCTKENILNNCKEVVTWINSNNYKIPTIEIFSGEFFQLPYYKDILKILNNLKEKTLIVLPTNSTFALSDKKLKEIEEVLEKYAAPDSKLNINLSASIDGKYFDNDTRPLRNEKEKYNDQFYDRLFDFGKKLNFGYHPMVSAQSIKQWPENFNWFIDNIMKHYEVDKKTAYSYLYLLEVRNPDWTEENLKDLAKFSEFLVDTTFKEFKDVPDYVENFLYGSSALNWFSNLTHIVGRGYGCSIQQTLCLRMSDLKAVPCHRTAHPGYEIGEFILNKEYPGSLSIKPINPNLWMFMFGCNPKFGPGCVSCPISSLCPKGCPGCNFEVNKDFFIQVPSVCNMEKTKAISIVKAWEKRGILDYILETKFDKNGCSWQEEQRTIRAQLLNIKRLLKNKNGEN